MQKIGKEKKCEEERERYLSQKLSSNSWEEIKQN